MWRSFKDIRGKDIPFDNKNELDLELQRDIVSNDVTAYLVHYNDNTYEVEEDVYKAIEKLIG